MTTFHLGDVLSITTGRLVSPDLIAGVYRILDHMTGDELMTHVLPRASEACGPALLAQHPQLAEIVPPERFDGKEHVFRWLAEQVAVYGERLEVAPLPAGSWERRDPIQELVERVGPENVTAVVVSGSPAPDVAS